MAVTFANDVDGDAPAATFSLRFAEVPEPGTPLLLGAGMLGAAAARRARRRR